MNPYAVAAKLFGPYLIASALSFMLAWYIQGLAVQSAENDLTTYKNGIAAAVIQQEKDAAKQREETANAWAKNLDSILKDNEGLRRCIAAGKCGGLRPVQAVPGSGSGLTLPASGRIDGSLASPVPAPTGAAAEDPPVIKDCQITVGLLNALQADIEKQKKRD